MKSLLYLEIEKAIARLISSQIEELKIEYSESHESFGWEYRGYKSREWQATATDTIVDFIKFLIEKLPD